MLPSYPSVYTISLTVHEYYGILGGAVLVYLGAPIVRLLGGCLSSPLRRRLTMSVVRLLRAARFRSITTSYAGRETQAAKGAAMRFAVTETQEGGESRG